MQSSFANGRPSRWEWGVVAAFAAVAVLYGAWWCRNRRCWTGRWAISASICEPPGPCAADPDHLYDHTDQNGWHYSYPPLFAILLSRSARRRSPPAADPTPFAVAVAIFYVVNLALPSPRRPRPGVGAGVGRRRTRPRSRAAVARRRRLWLAAAAGPGLPAADRPHADARPGQPDPAAAAVLRDGGGDPLPPWACRGLAGWDGLYQDISGLFTALSAVAPRLAGRGGLGRRPVRRPAADPGRGAGAGADGRLLPEACRRADRPGPEPERGRLAGQGTHRGDGDRQPVVPRRHPQHAASRPGPLAPADDRGAGGPLRPFRAGRPVHAADAGGREPAARGRRNRAWRCSWGR